jgi:NAD(P)-dependent dehydrogenase (short-subunit alcohol dehydrogenase family)
MHPPANSLQGKVALITGAASGLGEAAARLFAACGAKVGALDCNAPELKRVVDAITAAGGSALALSADVRAPEPLASAVAEIERHWGRLDLVFANAGINGVWAPVDEITPEEWDTTLDINLRGAFLTVRACVPLLKRSGGGSIILTASVSGTRTFGYSGATAYAASKAGLVAFGRMTALELARHKIRVNTICPGAFESNIRDHAEMRHLRDLHLPVLLPEGSVPLTGGPAPMPDRITPLVWFLASDLSDHITGTEVYIDGAQSLLTG